MVQNMTKEALPDKETSNLGAVVQETIEKRVISKSQNIQR